VLYRCYAKINLTLEILGKRADGYHDLASLVHTIALADDLRLELNDVLTTRVEGLDIEPTANLVPRAAILLATHTRLHPGAELTLVKRIPAAAGLGGGSSDAATTLVGLNHLWGTRLGLADLTILAAELGSDVPFFVRGGAALMRGRGDELQPLPPLHGQWLVLAVPTHDVADKTRQLYAALRPDDFSDGAATMRAADRLARGPTRVEADAANPAERPAHTAQALDQSDLVNGFARAARAVFPGLDQTWRDVEDVCGRRFHLSGAGPALFALAADRADALQQERKLMQRGLAACATRTVKHARASIRYAPEPAIRYS
jgi:4-diphosphocytidyl-2-C-methyl-D-erythritol kinase